MAHPTKEQQPTTGLQCLVCGADNVEPGRLIDRRCRAPSCGLLLFVCCPACPLDPTHKLERLPYHQPEAEQLAFALGA